MEERESSRRGSKTKREKLIEAGKSLNPGEEGPAVKRGKRRGDTEKEGGFCLLKETPLSSKREGY